MPLLLRPALFTALLLPAGCVVGTVVGTAVDVTATAVETTFDVAAGAVDQVVPDGDED